MELSSVMEISSNGLLIYKGHEGILYEVVGGTAGQINLRKLD